MKLTDQEKQLLAKVKDWLRRTPEAFDMCAYRSTAESRKEAYSQDWRSNLPEFCGTMFCIGGAMEELSGGTWRKYDLRRLDWTRWWVQLFYGREPYWTPAVETDLESATPEQAIQAIDRFLEMHGG